MTIINSVTHPSGVKYSAVAAYKIVRSPIAGLVKVRDKDAVAGVWIERPDGVKIFRPNSYYEHITGIAFEDPTTRTKKPE